MKKIKNILIATLVLAMALSLVACGGKTQNETSADTEKIEVSTDTEKSEVSTAIEKNKVFTKEFYDTVTEIQIPFTNAASMSLKDKEKINEFAEFMDKLEITGKKEVTGEETDDMTNTIIGGWHDVYFFAGEARIGEMFVQRKTVTTESIKYETNETVIDKLFDLLEMDKTVDALKNEFFSSNFANTVEKIDFTIGGKTYSLTDSEKLKAFGEFAQSLTFNDVSKLQNGLESFDDSFSITRNDGVWTFSASGNKIRLSGNQFNDDGATIPENVIRLSDATLESDKNILEKLLELVGQ